MSSSSGSGSSSSDSVSSSDSSSSTSSSSNSSNGGGSGKESGISSTDPTSSSLSESSASSPSASSPSVGPFPKEGRHDKEKVVVKKNGKNKASSSESLSDAAPSKSARGPARNGHASGKSSVKPALFKAAHQNNIAAIKEAHKSDPGVVRLPKFSFEL